MVTLKLLVAAALVGLCTGQGVNFTNPIDDLIYADPPSVLHLDGYYYMVVNDMVTQEMMFYKSEHLSNFRNAEFTKFFPFPPPVNSTGPALWGPKFHILDGDLYMYFCHQDQDNNDYWRQYVMKARNASDPMGEWEQAIEVLPNWPKSVMDGTVLEHGGKRYLLWNDDHSGFSSVYIAELASPSEITGQVSMIKYPSGRHECEGRCTSEAPHMIYRPERTYVVLTTSAPLHRVTYISITPEKDPMDQRSWDDVGETVFGDNADELVFRVGHVCFTDSPDGTETWMMHVANRNRSVSISYIALEKIDFAADGTPIFPMAHGWGHPQPVPSGERH